VKVVFTNHAKNRAEEFGSNEDDLQRAFNSAKKVRHFGKRLAYKMSKHGRKYLNQEEYRSRNWIFVVEEQEDKIVVITVRRKSASAEYTNKWYKS
jgi:hypothetical protein